MRRTGRQKDRESSGPHRRAERNKSVDDGPKLLQLADDESFFARAADDDCLLQRAQAASALASPSTRRW